MPSKIFIQSVTSLDCAVLAEEQLPFGKSWAVDIVWHGEKDQSGILIDFSTAKSLAKSIIDKTFDHKILTSKKLCALDTSEKVLLSSYPRSAKNIASEKFFSIFTFPNSIQFISDEALSQLKANCCDKLEIEISQEILKHCPKNIDNVHVKLRECDEHANSNYFHYTHSLCHHKGNCQRFHGHSNIVNVYKNGLFETQLSAQMATQLNHKYLIHDSYLVSSEIHASFAQLLEFFPCVKTLQKDLAGIDYIGNQGQNTLWLAKSHVIPFSTESTVENIAEYIWKKLTSDTSLEKEKYDIQVHAFEGMNKGAICP